MTTPLVSIICVSFNHRQFVEEAVESALKQAYPNLEVVLVDDGSTDGSREVVESLGTRYPSLKVVLHDHNMGYCKSFNDGFRRSTGSYVIDLAADDVLLSARVTEGVRAFDQGGSQVGVNFTDAERIAPGGDLLYLHSDLYPHESIPQGDVYQPLIERYFICSPTMMIRREVLDEMRGYDEGLTYEDFDLWIRSSRDWKYAYTPKVLVKKRSVRHSLSSYQRSHNVRHQASTLRVCEKIYNLNRTKQEFAALRRRVAYEWIQSIRGFNLRPMLGFTGLWLKSMWQSL